MFAAIQTFIDVLVGAQTELAIFFIAIATHQVLFGSYSISKPSPKKFKRSRSPPQGSADVNRDASSAAPIIRAVKLLMQQGAGQDAITQELDRQLKSCSQADALDLLQGMLEGIGKTASPELLGAVRAVLREQSLCLSAKLGEFMLRGYLAMHLQTEFDEVLAEVEGMEDATNATALLALRAALVSSDFETAMGRVRTFAAQWRSSGQTPSAAPQGLMQQLARLAADNAELPRLFHELCDCGLFTSWTLESLLMECVLQGETATFQKAKELACTKSLELTPMTCCALVRAADTDSAVLQIYDTHLADVDILADTGAARLIADAAFNLKRPEIITKLVGLCKDSSKQVALMRSFGNERCLAKAKTIFEACREKSTCLYNTFLSISIECKDYKAVGRLMAEAQAANVADVVTYNTIIKAHLLAGDARRANAVIESMQAVGLAPNCVTFNELIDATIKTDSQAAWSLIEKMQACGVKPSQVTCSILLKSIQRTSRAVEVDRTLGLIDSLEETDEVLLGSACEACIRAGRSDLLLQQLRRQRSTKRIQAKSAHTFGSLIRAYGFVQDLNGTWEMWREMCTQHILPTSITIGCMVEALVSNGDPEAGYELIHELLGEDKTRPLVNAVIYCSVLKGFSHQKQFQRVWSIYEEMLAENIQFSIVTYNALIDACARSCEMVRIPPLLEEMNRQAIEPNVVTYSTILKGYCNENKLDMAFELLTDMKRNMAFQPDEITYNTLLDGCARQGLYKRGVAVLEEMEEVGVRPSNFTLSLLAKLASRSQMPDQAFQLCESIAKKYNIRMNVHVYNNLVQACTKSCDITRAIGVFDRMLQEKVYPDARTYMLLLRSCVSAGKVQEAEGLIRAAMGLRGGAWQGAQVKVRGGLSGDLISEILEGIMGTCSDKEVTMNLMKDLRSVPGFRLDARLQMRLTSRG